MQDHDNTRENIHSSPQNNNNSEETSQPEIKKAKAIHDFKSIKLIHVFYGIMSFVMTALFYVAFYSVDWIERILTGDTSTVVTTSVWAISGLLFSAVITMMIVKSHKANIKSMRVLAYALIFGLGIAFNVFTETASTMDRVDERVKIKSEKSAVFKALTNKIQTAGLSSNSEVVNAQKQYADAKSTMDARCKKGAGYNKRLCTKWTMRTNEYAMNVQAFKDSASTDLDNTVSLAKGASYDTKQAQMVIKLLMDSIGLSMTVATLLISLFMISTFEILGLAMGREYRRCEDQAVNLGLNLYSKSIVRLAKEEQKQAILKLKIDQKAMLDKKALQLVAMKQVEQTSIELKQTADRIRALRSNEPINENVQPVPASEPAIEQVQKNRMGFDLTPTTSQEQKAEPAPTSTASQNTSAPYLDYSIKPSKVYSVYFDKDKKADKKGDSAKEIMKRILSDIKRGKMEKKFYNVAIKVQNKNDEQDVTVHILRPPFPSKIKDTKINMTDTEALKRRINQEPDKMRALHAKATKAKNGDVIKCPVCEAEHKKAYNRVFCTNGKKGRKRPDGGNCSDDYYNIIKPERTKARKMPA